jgi:hypothetical protein
MILAQRVLRKTAGERRKLLQIGFVAKKLEALDECRRFGR